MTWPSSHLSLTNSGITLVLALPPLTWWEYQRHAKSIEMNVGSTLSYTFGYRYNRRLVASKLIMTRYNLQRCPI
ncbi:hypothetical protein L218DRAFT_668180 [Marasmius fiardii PR-910]|nr:hypothetical protein L218DRAFT_668180 [Marasmius fiardii PR-910]